MVERVHRQIKDALLARAVGLGMPSYLPWVLLGLHAAPKEDSSTSSAELVLGSPLLLPGEMMQVQEPPGVHVPPPPTRPASHLEATNTPPSHLVGVEYVYMHAGG
jgi:hypothetical protein